MYKDYETQINATFKSIYGHLKGVKISTFNQLKKSDYVANYTVLGEFVGYTKTIGDGDIQIKLKNISNKGEDLKRELALEREYFELDILQALNNEKINN
jgi:hypothetical protein